MKIQIKRTSNDAVIPAKTNLNDAGYDLSSIEKVLLGPMQRHCVSTGVIIAVPEGYYARIAPRSGLAVKKGIDVLAGVVDSGYRGEIKVVLINLGNQAHRILKGDRVAQIIIEKCFDAEFEEVSSFVENDERGAAGFGSSGN